MKPTVKVKLLGVFRGLVGKDQLLLRLKHPTIRGVVLALAESSPAEARSTLIDPELGDPRPNALILVNGREISVLNGLETVINNGDEVVLVPVAHGG